MRLLGISLLACLAGLAGAKIYYRATHRGEKNSLLGGGMSLQGFILASLGTLGIGAALSAVPIGPALDATAAGLLFGAAAGRIGCFLGGCCAGRPTTFRWGLWSSNRTIGIRRVPVQLADSALAGLLGLVALLLTSLTSARPEGGIFVGTVAAYVLGRQLLFPLREIPRVTTHGRRVMILVTSASILADLAIAWLG